MTEIFVASAVSAVSTSSELPEQDASHGEKVLLTLIARLSCDCNFIGGRRTSPAGYFGV